MKPVLHLHPDGRKRYEQWRDRTDTDPEDIPLVQQVLATIADHGWPPTVQEGNHRPPRLRWFVDAEIPDQSIVAPAEHLWVVIAPPEADLNVFDFITVHYPTEDERQRALDHG